MRKLFTLIIVAMAAVGQAKAAEISALGGLDLKIKNGDNWISKSFTKLDDGYKFTIELTESSIINILNTGTFEFKIVPNGWTDWVGPYDGYESVTTTKNVANNTAYGAPTFKVSQNSAAYKLQINVLYVGNHNDKEEQFYVTAAAIEDECTIYFDKTQNNKSKDWSTLYFWPWKDDHNFYASWPGSEMTSTASTGVYQCIVPSIASVIFNDGTTQSEENKPNHQSSSFDAISKNGIYYYDVLNSIRVSISSVGYATFSSTKALDFSSEPTIEACTAKVNTDNGRINYTAVTSVAANEGVLLRRKDRTIASASSDIPLHADQSVGKNANNDFIAITSKQSIPQTSGGKTNYILTNQTSGGTTGPLGFYKVNTAGSWCAANTAYLATTYSAASSRDYFPVVEDETEGISATLMDNAENGKVYNLAGQRIAEPQKGLYIVNGKKVIIK